MKTGRFLALVASLALAASCGGKTDPAAAAAATADTSSKSAPVGSLAWAVAGKWRMESETARDAWRHPVETLDFFGVKSSDTVVEIFPGGGWYTAILGPWLKAGGGRLYAAHPDPASSAGARANVEAYAAAFANRPEVYGDITITVASPTAPGIAPDGSADVVLTFRNIHNWMAGGYADKIFADAYRALKPGGVFGVVEHRLPSARDQDLSASSGYVSESYVTQMAEEAGFVLEASSEINANPKDKADHPLGVWMLPPNMRAPGSDDPLAATYDAGLYTAIGESDRMTLKFRKPAPDAVVSPAPAEPVAPQ
jgi:predicted methyltransferase